MQLHEEIDTVFNSHANYPKGNSKEGSGEGKQ